MNNKSKEELMQRTMRNILFAENILAVPTDNNTGLYFQLYGERCPNRKIEISVYFKKGYIELKEYFDSVGQEIVKAYLDSYRSEVFDFMNSLNLNRWVLMKTHNYSDLEAPSFAITEEFDFAATYVLPSSVSFSKLLNLIHTTAEIMEEISDSFFMVITGGISAKEAKKRLPN